MSAMNDLMTDIQEDIQNEILNFRQIAQKYDVSQKLVLEAWDNLCILEQNRVCNDCVV